MCCVFFNGICRVHVKVVDSQSVFEYGVHNVVGTRLKTRLPRLNAVSKIAIDVFVHPKLAFVFRKYPLPFATGLSQRFYFLHAFHAFGIGCLIKN